MMVGHAAAAFAIAALAGSRLGWPRRRALAFGAAAAGFAVVPDVDMLYAVVGAAAAGPGDVWELTAAFWGSSTLVHRAITHSLVVSAVAAVAFAASVGDAARRLGGVALLAALVAAALATSGALGGAIVTAFALAGVGVAVVAARRTELGGRSLLAAALVGLLSHPFGDLFTGTPPRFLYPVDVRLLDARLAFHPDPTLNLLAIFGLELATFWLAGLVALRLIGRRPADYVDARAAAGAAYAAATVVLPAPTLDVSYHFVFSILAVGTVGVAPRLHPARMRRPADRHDALAWALTGLAAITLAAVAYTAAYLMA